MVKDLTRDADEVTFGVFAESHGAGLGLCDK